MPNDLRPYIEQAQLCEARGDREGAIVALRAALELDPKFAPAYKNLAFYLWKAGRLEESREVLVRAMTELPGDATLLVRLARSEADLGMSGDALAHAGQAEKAEPSDAPSWSTLSALYAEIGRWPDAERTAARAAQLAPGQPEVELRLARARQEHGDTPGALEALGRAARQMPPDLNAVISERLFLPQLYNNREQLDRWRRRYGAGMARLESDLDRLIPQAREVFALNHNNFLLAYHGEDDLELQRAYSRFLARFAAAARPDLMEPLERTFDGSRRLRVGFVSHTFRDHTAGRYFERWITALDPQRFERFVYHAAPIVDDLTRRIEAGSEHFTRLRQGDLDAALRIKADRLDILVLPDVGMSPMSYLLAALRLAPVQVAGWGHPITTGSANIDYFLTCAPMEPPDGDRHYSEPLVRLPGIGVDYTMPTHGPATRASFGLPEGRRIYVCPQSLFKVHPDMDDLFARVAESDEDGVLLFFQAPARAVSEQFGRRLQAALVARGVPPRKQVSFLPRLDGANFRRVLAASDVVLDTIHWSGGNTSLDAIAAATPLVALPGRFMRGRQTAAMLGLIGLEELVAKTPEDYVRVAVDVARDRDRNRALREAIVARRGALFDRPEAVAALGESLLSMAAGSIIVAETQGSR